MKEEIYLISDAAKQVQVESHVLRYWEEELKLPIRRNELGHRYYTKDDIEQLKQIKELKEKGLQLKAIKLVISGRDMEILRRDPETLPPADAETAVHEEIGGKSGMQEEKTIRNGETDQEGRLKQEEEALRNGGMKKEVTSIQGAKETAAPVDGKAEKSLRLQMLLQRMISDAVRVNNDEMYEMFREILLKELDYQFRVQEEAQEAREQQRQEREEEHFRKLDELLGEKRKGKGEKSKRKKHSWF